MSAGERWRIEQYAKADSYFISVENGRTIGRINRLADAEHIVSLHNTALSAATNAGAGDAVARLKEALGLIEHWHRDAEEYPSWAYQYRDKLFQAEDLIRSALASVEQEGDRGE